MNTYLISMIGKYMSIFVVFILSLFGSDVNTNTENVSITNDTRHSISIVNTIIPYDTKYIYSSKVPYNINRTIVNGEDGIKYTSSDGSENLLRPMISEEILTGTGPYGEFNGVMTGYGPDCKTCSGRGFVACRTKDKQSFNLIENGIHYDDEEFGDVRVVAAALSKFPCGTIVYIENSRFDSFYGVVLDTGAGMINAFEKDIIHFDIAFETENDENVNIATDWSGNVKYSVQRWGW